MSDESEIERFRSEARSLAAPEMDGESSLADRATDAIKRWLLGFVVFFFVLITNLKNVDISYIDAHTGTRSEFLWEVIVQVCGAPLLLACIPFFVLRHLQRRARIARPRLEVSNLAPEGWYSDPGGSGGHRWWDGANWTDEVTDSQVEPHPSDPGEA